MKNCQLRVVEMFAGKRPETECQEIWYLMNRKCSQKLQRLLLLNKFIVFQKVL